MIRLLPGRSPKPCEQVLAVVSSAWVNTVIPAASSSGRESSGRNLGPNNGATTIHRTAPTMPAVTAMAGSVAR